MYCLPFKTLFLWLLKYHSFLLLLCACSFLPSQSFIDFPFIWLWSKYAIVFQDLCQQQNFILNSITYLLHVNNFSMLMTSLALSLRSRTLLSNCLPNMFIQKFHKNLISPCLKWNYLLFLSPLDGLGISILFSSIAFHSYLYQAIAPIYLCLPFPTYYELFKECIHSFKYLLCSMHSTRYSS